MTPFPYDTYGGSQIPFLSGQMVASPEFVFVSRDRDLDRGRMPARGGPGPLTRLLPSTPSPLCSRVQLPAVKEELLLLLYPY